jgi:hypothetical protein
MTIYLKIEVKYSIHDSYLIMNATIAQAFNIFKSQID